MLTVFVKIFIFKLVYHNEFDCCASFYITLCICNLQLTAWFAELKTELESIQIADSVETAAEALQQFEQQKEVTESAYDSTTNEGRALIEQLK